MKRIKIAATVVISLLAVLGFGPAGMAAAAPVAAATPTGPTVKMTQPTFQSLTDEGCATCGVTFPTAFDAVFTLPWTVTSPNGVCKQKFTEQDYNDLGGAVDPILGFDTYTFPLASSARSYSGGDGFFYDYFRGGYNAVVRVTDCHGVTAASNPVHTVIVPGDNTDAAMNYVGTWKTATCTCFLGGNAYYTTAKGASVSFVTPQPSDSTGVRVALLMPKGSGRGSAALYVDNVYRTTINTYKTGPNVNGVINYQLLLTGTHTHLIRLVNLATAGHPRIDLDATINGG